MYSTRISTVPHSQLVGELPYFEGNSSETVSYSSISYERPPDLNASVLNSEQSQSAILSTSATSSLLNGQPVDSTVETDIFSDDLLSRSIQVIRSKKHGASRTSLPIMRASKPPVLRKRPFSSQLQNYKSYGKLLTRKRTPISGPSRRSVRSPFVPLLERMRKVNGSLPERFKLNPTKRIVSPISNRLTVPKAPKLLTEIRSQFHPKPPSPAAPEPFRARPVNTKVLLSRGNLGVPRIIKPNTTVPRSPNIGRSRRQNTPHPNLGQLHRAASSHRTHINHSGHKFTVPHPFTFASDKIAASKMKEFETKVREQMREEERVRCFKATPMPSFSPKVLPKTSPKPLTVPKPFVFAAEARSARYERLMQQKIDEEGRRRLNKTPLGFRARPAPKLVPVPGVRKSIRPPTVPQPVVLHSEQRVRLRQVFEENLQKKIDKQEEIRQREIQAQKEREELQLRRLRNQLVPKAHPVPTYTFFQPKKSTRPLTSPHSPNFTKRRKL